VQARAEALLFLGYLIVTLATERGGKSIHPTICAQQFKSVVHTDDLILDSEIVGLKDLFADRIFIKFKSYLRFN